MATATRELPTAPQVAPDRLYRLSLEQYQRIANAEILGPRDKVFLLYGLLVKKLTKGDPHLITTNLTWEALRPILPAGWHITKEDPIALPDGPADCPSVPEPDLSIRRGTIRDYRKGPPRPADVPLVVEVSDSTLREDRAMLECYAWNRIPITWLVNLNERVVEVYTGPTGPDAQARYRRSERFGEDAEVPVAIAGAEVGRIRVRDLLP